METFQYILIAIVLIVFLGPALFADRSPIIETSGKVFKPSTLAELEQLLSSTKHVIIDFYADWCPPCRAIAPVFSKLADEYASEGKLAFAKVNVDHLKDAMSKFEVTCMPTFLFFEEGKQTAVTVGGKEGKEGGKVVEKIMGADQGALRGVVRALAERS